MALKFTKDIVNFISKADKFVVLFDSSIEEFPDYPSAARFYNNHVRTANSIEIQAHCGIVGITIAYRYN